MAAPMADERFACFYVFLLLSSLIATCRAWDNEDFELFDQVEEINQNFYELLGVKEDASTQEVRRAYRKLSLQLHPDKNPAEDAEIKFRQLVSVYETLKDEGRREKYNNILVNGLPDWRQPIFYYRRVRKLGLLEMMILLFGITTLGQYLYKWAVYCERRLTIDDMVGQFRRKSERRKKRLKANDDPDAIEESLINQLPKPSVTELLPFQLWRLLKWIVLDGPRFVLSLREAVVEYRKQRQLLVEESDSDTEVVERVRSKPKRRQLANQEDDDLYKQTASPVSYTQTVDAQSSQSSQTNETRSGVWTNDDFIALSKAVARFPGGTVGRWEKIAEFVGRPQPEVVAKSRSLKTHINTSVDPSMQGTTGAGSAIRKARSTMTDEMATQRDDVTPSKPCSETSSELCSETSQTGELFWKQEEQKCLEWALVQYPKGTEERWEKIAKEISGKTKEQCIERFKHLAILLRKKRQQTLPKSQ